MEEPASRDDSTTATAFTPLVVDVMSLHSSEVLRYPFAGSVIVGRAIQSDIRLPDPRVSRQHARFERLDHGRVRLEDLGSTNGTGSAGRLLRQSSVVVSVPAVVHIEPFVLVLRSEAGDEDDTLRVSRAQSAVALQFRPDGGIVLGDVQVRVTRLQRRLLEVLVAHYPEHVTHQVLGDSIWGPQRWALYMVQNVVRRSRDRLDDAGGAFRIESVRSAGYRLVPLDRGDDARADPRG